MDPRGAHWKAKREAAGIPEEKVCERCGRTYSKSEVGSQRLAHWIQRRFCGEECRRASRVADEAARGADSPNWKGDDIKADSGRMRARRRYADPEPCEVCGAKAERHHKDGNTLNNEPENIAWLCRLHHIEAEDRMAYRRTTDRSEVERERDRQKQRRYQQRKKGLLPPPPPPKGSEEDRAYHREATRRYRLRQKGELPPVEYKLSEAERKRRREAQARYRARKRTEQQ